jgi:hypothetical protein
MTQSSEREDIRNALFEIENKHKERMMLHMVAVEMEQEGLV